LRRRRRYPTPRAVGQAVWSCIAPLGANIRVCRKRGATRIVMALAVMVHDGCFRRNALTSRGFRGGLGPWSGRQEYALAKQGEAGAAVHLAFDHLDPVSWPWLQPNCGHPPLGAVVGPASGLRLPPTLPSRVHQRLGPTSSTERARNVGWLSRRRQPWPPAGRCNSLYRNVPLTADMDRLPESQLGVKSRILLGASPSTPDPLREDFRSCLRYGSIFLLSVR
jgi:hypothetical protein